MYNSMLWIQLYNIEEVGGIVFYHDFLLANWCNANNFAETEDNTFYVYFVIQ